MRTDKRYTRAKEIVTDPLVPRLENGGIALCHMCQRSCFFAAGAPPNNRGFMRYLIKRVRLESGRSNISAGLRRLAMEVDENAGSA